MKDYHAENEVAAPEPIKVSKRNADLAMRIVQQRATITEWPDGYDVDMISVIGVRHEEATDDKEVAIKNAAQRVGEMLERGDLVLADGWEKDNLSGK